MKAPRDRTDYEFIPTIKSIDNFDYIAHIDRQLYFQQISSLLESYQHTLFKLWFFIMVSVDRLLDSKSEKPYFALKLKDLMQSCWLNQTYGLPKNQYERTIINFTETLKQYRKKHKNAEDIFNNCQLHLNGEYHNASRIGKLLSNKKLKTINKNAVVFGFTAVYEIITDKLQKEDLFNVISKYAYAAMVADDLVDFDEDIKNKILNIPSELYFHIMEKTKNHKNYYILKYNECDELFNKGDEILKPLITTLPNNQSKCLLLFRDICYTWLLDAKQTFPFYFNHSHIHHTSLKSDHRYFVLK